MAHELPGARRAVVNSKKVVDYLLSAEHPDGRSKATFFSGFGFRAERWEVLAEALRDHGVKGDVTGRVHVRKMRGCRSGV